MSSTGLAAVNLKSPFRISLSCIKLVLFTGLLTELKLHFKYSNIPKGKFVCVLAAEQV